MSAKTAAYFDLWGALRVCVSGDLAHGLARGYMRKFAHYRVDQFDGDADLIFDVGAFDPPPGHAFLFNEYRIGAGYLYRTHRYKIAKWATLIRGLDGSRWSVGIFGNRAAGVMAPHLSMTSLTFLALSMRGWVSVHAAALSHAQDRSRSVLLAGRRGVGKTTIAGRLMRAGYDVVSEDRVFIKGGEVRGLRVPVNIKFDRSDPQIARLSSGTRWRIRRNHVLSKATGGYISLHEPVALGALIADRLCDVCSLDRVLYLQSGPGLSVTPDADARSIARRVVLGNAYDDPSLEADLLAYRFCHPSMGGVGGDVWERDRDGLSASLSGGGVTRFDVVVPASPTEAQWERVMEVAS